MDHPLSTQLRAAIEAGPSRYKISKATGVAESVLSRFVNGKASLDLQTVDKLADYLALELVAKHQPSGPRARRPSARLKSD